MTMHSKGPSLQKHILDDGQILVTHMERFKAA
jgi:hypothetical protein